MKALAALIALSLACVSPASAKGKGRAKAVIVAAAVGTIIVRGGSGTRATLDPRLAPPLAEERKINEQDCSQPVDWTAGNLRCK